MPNGGVALAVLLCGAPAGLRDPLVLGLIAKHREPALWGRYGGPVPQRRVAAAPDAHAMEDAALVVRDLPAAFPGGGITGNLVDKAKQLGIPVHEVRA